MSTPPAVTLPIDRLMEEVEHAQRRLEAVVRDLHEAELREASALPGWTRGHVLTHIARNADGQALMLEGAQRGEVLDQYPGGDEQRSADIETGAGRGLDEILADLAGTDRRFLDAAQAMSHEAWDRLVRPRAGVRPAWASVWARWREVEVHLVDLGLGPESPASRPSAAFVDAFLPGELSCLPARLPESVTSSTSLSETGGEPAIAPIIELEGNDTDRLLWLLGRRSGPVCLTVDGVEVHADQLAPWQRAMWSPSGP